MGRPKGYSPGYSRVTTHKIGEWSWDTNKLHSRIQAGDPSECWIWKGSKGPQGNLLGAFKNGRAQMTQSNRLIQMEILNEPIDGLSVKMRCGNKHCTNPNHFKLIQGRNPRKNTSEDIQQAFNKQEQPWQPETAAVVVEQKPEPIPEEKKTHYKLTLAEYAFNELTVQQRMNLRQMANDYANNAGINWEFEYRWMTMSKQNWLLASMRFPEETGLLKVTEINV